MNQEEQPILSAINQSFSYDHEEPEQCEAPASYPVLEVSQPPVFRPMAPQASPAAQPQIVVQRPVYNTVGVPMHVAPPQQMQVRLDLPGLQSKVKCWSKFLVVISYLLMISGAFKFFTNLIFLFNTGSFSTVAWYDRHGNYRNIKMDEGALSLLAIIQMIAGGVLVFKQGKLTKMIFGPILTEYRQAESGQTNGIQMTQRKAPKMQWLKKMVKKITCGIISLTIFSLIVCKNFALDIAQQVITQEYEIMENKNHSSIDFNFDPEQFWINPKHDESRPVFHPFKLDDDLDFDFKFETDEDIFSNHQINEEDIFKMLGNMNETVGGIITPYFNTTEVEPLFNESSSNSTLPLPRGRGDHDKKHHSYKHHQKHGKNMMKQGFKFDMHKMSKQECLQMANTVITSVLVFVAFWSSMGIMFWQGLFICAINKAKKPQTALENHFMGPEAGQTLPQAQNNQGTIQYIAVQPNQVQPQYVQIAPQHQVATGNIARANTFE